MTDMTASERAQLAWDNATTCAQQEPDKYFKECFLLNVETQIRQAEAAVYTKGIDKCLAIARRSNDTNWILREMRKLRDKNDVS